MSEHESGNDHESAMRIGELADRVGLTTHALRAWETRYGLLRPTRSVGGYRLYGPDDERRVRAVLALRRKGTAPAQAAATVLAQDQLSAPTPAPRDRRAAGIADSPAAFATAMFAAVHRFDERAADTALDQLLAHTSLEAAIDDAVLPFLAEVGRRWERDSLSVAQEHFISAVLRRRFAPLSLSTSQRGPLAVLAAPSGELHDLPLVLFASLLSRAGWQVRLLGANTPVSELAAASDGATVVVLATTNPDVMRAEAAGVRLLASQVPVAIAGAGATAVLAKRTHTTLLPERQGDALARLTELVAGARS